MANESPTNEAVVLVVGGGAREHAICWKLAQSALVKKIFCAPGNGGTAGENKTENVAVEAMDFAGLVAFARQNNVALTVIGPDNPLAEGIVDRFRQANLRVFGPTKAMARLESSKAYAKQFLTQTGIPTPKYAICKTYEEAEKTVRTCKWARVVKADGLALGKGVFVCDCESECLEALQQIFKKKIFGASGDMVVIEEKIVGEELSLMLFSDGKTFVSMPASQDHKRRYDGDSGPNTGGMGAYAPAPLYKKYAAQIEQYILKPLQQALNSGALQYEGVLYPGIIFGASLADAENRIVPQVLEFNARFGDPEAEVILPLLESDLYEIFWAATSGVLGQYNIRWRQDVSLCVAITGDAYPAGSSRGEEITIGTLPDYMKLFHAGTKLDNGRLVTNGGRIIVATVTAPDIVQAREKAYKSLNKISFKGMSYRKDIGEKALAPCLST